MADKYLLESSDFDNLRLEDESGDLLLETSVTAANPIESGGGSFLLRPSSRTLLYQPIFFDVSLQTPVMAIGSGVLVAHAPQVGARGITGNAVLKFTAGVTLRAGADASIAKYVPVNIRQPLFIDLRIPYSSDRVKTHIIEGAHRKRIKEAEQLLGIETVL